MKRNGRFIPFLLVLTCPRFAVPSVLIRSVILLKKRSEGTSRKEDALLRLPQSQSIVFSLSWCFTRRGSKAIERGGLACKSSGSGKVLPTVRQDQLYGEASGQWETFEADPRLCCRLWKSSGMMRPRRCSLCLCWLRVTAPYHSPPFCSVARNWAGTFVAALTVNLLEW